MTCDTIVDVKDLTSILWWKNVWLKIDSNGRKLLDKSDANEVNKDTAILDVNNIVEKCLRFSKMFGLNRCNKNDLAVFNFTVLSVAKLLDEGFW